MPDEKQINNDQNEELDTKEDGPDSLQDAYDDYESIRDLIKKPSDNKNKEDSSQSNQKENEPTAGERGAKEEQADLRQADSQNVNPNQSPEGQDRRPTQETKAPQNTNPRAKENQTGQATKDASESNPKSSGAEEARAPERAPQAQTQNAKGTPATQGEQGAKGALSQAGKTGASAEKNLAGQGLKAGAKQAGKEVAKEGALAASRTAAAAAAPESMGASLAAQAGIEAASRSVGFIQKNFWLILTIVIALSFVIGGGFAYTYLAKFFFFNKLGGEEKQLLNDLRDGVKQERLVLQNDEDIQKIEKGVGSFVATSLINELSNNHEKIKINYLGSQDSSSGNEPYEFDVLGADIIKCVNLASSSKAGEFFVDFGQSAWQQELKNLGANTLCAVDYYPKIEQAKTGKYSDHYQIREFSADQADAFIDKIIAYKQAQIIDETADIAANEQKQQDNLLAPPDVIRVSEQVVSGLPPQLIEKVKSAKNYSSFSLATFPKGASNTAMHISYLE
ncbi:MAG: hypothetical protein BWY43_00523 [candidate division WS2 bacterium ADurb.Bin280]|uniref:Uncharacterized protein n=1 Tax=candidate division WS2 bacterium ADurb.Bin280 TaxID=1852829 RepID=A0A1V5SD57_9BACT|nr:MAG: hypothetical protein BWY43_00523 [candidate division WS2 bacterium ADurb.Bin280]